MKKWFWIGAAVLLAVCAASAWFAFQRPDFMVGFVAAFGAALWKAFAPSILKALKPKNFTADQLERIRRGENPFHDRGGKG